MSARLWLVGGFVAGIAAAVLFAPRGLSAPEKEPSAEPSLRAVAALGRLEPASRVVRLAATMMGEGQRVQKLLVGEGQAVEANAVVALLDAHEARLASLAEADARVGVAKARLAQVKAGARPGDIAARESAVKRLRAVLENADYEYRRCLRLVGAGAMSRAEFDQKKMQRDSAAHELRQVESEYASVSEVREVDVALAAAEVRQAEAAAASAKAQLDLAQIRAPVAGRVLKVNSWPGERVSDKGLVELGDTDRMHAVAEVYEADVPRVRAGQAARVKVPALGATLAGKVEQVGLLIGKKDVLNNDPVADTDARVVEVRVALGREDSRRVAGLTHLRVEVVIQPGE